MEIETQTAPNYGGEQPCSISKPDITLTIPEYLSKEFLGIMALDVLHDSKGHGYLVGHKLSQLTDLLADAIFVNNDISEPQLVRDYLFNAVLQYFLELWSDNISALGLDEVPNDSVPIAVLRNNVKLPFRSVAGRDDEDTFIRLGKNKYGIEAQNYHDQRKKLSEQSAELMSFISPKGIRKPTDYFRQAAGIVDIIRTRTGNNAKAVLDMKASAGLIRTITDPLGYTTGLPTYADPGYNMPGMSAIRQHAEIAFLDNNSVNQYSGTKEFRYCVQLQVPFNSQPLTMLDTTYFYGVAQDGLNRSNVMINILNDHFKNKLPRSMMMADALGSYLKPASTQVSASCKQALQAVEMLTWDYYNHFCSSLVVIDELQSLYSQLNSEQKLPLSVFRQLTKHLHNNDLAKELYNWCNEENTVYRTSYVLATLRNMHFFDLLVSENLLPQQMITTTMPKLMYDYIVEQEDFFSAPQKVAKLAFCHHQLTLLQQFIGKPDNSLPYQEDLDNLLTSQWLPKRKGKLVNQICKQVTEWRKALIQQLQIDQSAIDSYLQQLISYTSNHLGVVLDLQDADIDDPRVERFLVAIPEFHLSPELENGLLNQLHFYQPEMYYRSAAINRKGLLLATLLDVILCNKPLLEVSFDLKEMLTKVITPLMFEYRHDHVRQDALQMVLGKFSGDFGQIMWSICNGHIFASEDNNTSAMALMLHRLPKEYIHCTEQRKVWGSIHGLGDGSCVDITINKEI